jgi:hypothetical protein
MTFTAVVARPARRNLAPGFGDMAKADYTRLNQALIDLLALGVPPIAITFLDAPSAAVCRGSGAC